MNSKSQPVQIKLSLVSRLGKDNTIIEPRLIMRPILFVFVDENKDSDKATIKALVVDKIHSHTIRYLIELVIPRLPPTRD